MDKQLPLLTGRTLDVDGYWDAKNNIAYIGKAVERVDGMWQCLANVGGALCLVECKVTIEATGGFMPQRPAPHEGS